MNPGPRAALVQPGAAVIEPVAYDTAWIAGLRDPASGHQLRFPAARAWLLDAQHGDGSWGSSIPYTHDRVICTLAALIALQRGVEALQPEGIVQHAIARGVRYLWLHGHRLTEDPLELVGAELLLPMLIERARYLGLPVPDTLDVHAERRAQKLRLIPPALLYSPATTVAHSLEFLGNQADPAALAGVLNANGASGNSPAATAFQLELTNDARALGYLEESLRHAARQGVPPGGVPVLYPAEMFEVLWAAYHLFLAGVPACRLLSRRIYRALQADLAADGVSLSRTFPIPDADDTAVAILLLAAAGGRPDPRVLARFAASDGSFVSFPYERHGSVGVNLHVLHALLMVPGYPDAARTIAQLLTYLEAHQHADGSWLDKWHISRAYATSHAVRVLQLATHLTAPAQAAQAARLLHAAYRWLRECRRADGTWGSFGAADAEETAYAVLALAGGHESSADDPAWWHGARRLLAQPSNEPFPAMWVDKCLYTPRLVVRSVLEAARTLLRCPADPQPTDAVSRAMTVTPRWVTDSGRYLPLYSTVPDHASRPL